VSQNWHFQSGLEWMISIVHKFIKYQRLQLANVTQAAGSSVSFQCGLAIKLLFRILA